MRVPGRGWKIEDRGWKIEDRHRDKRRRNRSYIVSLVSSILNPLSSILYFLSCSFDLLYQWSFGRVGSEGSAAAGAASSSAKISIASCASAPQTSRVSSVPCSAANNMSSRGLLPLTRWSSLTTVTVDWYWQARWAKTVSGRMWNPKGSCTVTLRRRTWPFMASWLCCLGREEDSITVS